MAYLGSTPITQSFIAGTDTFSGTGSQTAFTLSRPVNTVNDILVVVNNVDQQPSNYTVSGSTLTFSPAPSSGTNNIYVRFLTTTLISYGSSGGSSFPSGTAMLFVQTAAPTGWTKSTTHNDKALRIVSGAASTGGSVAFTTAFASGLNAGNTTLTVNQIPSHTHGGAGGAAGGGAGVGDPQTVYDGSGASGATGGGLSHNHTLPSFAVSYVDVIIATKD